MLNGLNHEVSALHSRDEKLTKNKLTDSLKYSAIVHLRREPIAANSENVPYFQSSGYKRKSYYLFKHIVLISHI